MTKLQRTEALHSLDMNYRVTRHKTDLLVKEEEARRLKLRGVLLRNENASLKDQISQRDSHIRKLSEQADDTRGQLESIQEKCRRQEKMMQTQSRDIANLKVSFPRSFLL